MNKMKKLLLMVAVLFSATATTAAEALWLRYPAISPDGKTVAFTYMGDIYLVNAKGGKARLLVSHTAHDYSPIWSPDGKQIAFASDRHGNFDLFTIPVSGGEPRRITTHSVDETPWTFSPDGKVIYFSADLHTSAASRVYGAKKPFLHQLYTVPATGGRPQLILPTATEEPSIFASGDAFVYQDRPGAEEVWRKHHTSAVARDIWLYRDGKHTKLTTFAGEDRVPRLSADGKTVYFLSERDGSFNVYSFPLDRPQEVTRHTTHTTHPVRSLSIAKNGTLCYTFDGQLYVKRPNASSQLLKISVPKRDPLPKRTLQVATSNNAIVTPDGSEMIFAFNGELFVTTTDENTETRRLTETVATESEPAVSPDGRTLVYASERQGKWNLFSITLPEGEKSFLNCKQIVEKQLLSDMNFDRRSPKFSPDGKELSFIENRDRIMVLTLATGAVRQVTDGSYVINYPGTYPYSWSPNGKWFTFAGEIVKHHTDIGLVNASGKEPFINMSRSGYPDSSPTWVATGDAILFLSERYGRYSDSRVGGGSRSVYMLFLNRAAQERYTTPRSQHKAMGITAPSTDVYVEPQVFNDRLVRMTTETVTELTTDREGRYAYGLSKGKLVRLDLYKPLGKMKVLGSANGKLVWDAAYKTLFVLGKNSKRYNVKSGTFSPIAVSAELEVDPAAEYGFMVDHIHNEIAHRFYVKNLHGVDWTMYYKAYRRFAPHIANNHEFIEMTGELLGELNVSHTGTRSDSQKPHKSHDVTGELGIYVDYNYKGDGLKVEEILAGGPFDRATSKLAAGDFIESIEGTTIKAGMDYYPLLNRKAGKVIRVTIRKASGELVEECVIPINRATYEELRYQRWMARNAADVERLSGGKLGYVHLPANNGGTYPHLYSTALGRYYHTEALVFDIRNNGGGALHARLEEFFCGTQYLTAKVRGLHTKMMPRRRWIRPSTLLICEGCYSDGHGTTWMYDHLDLGKTVGMPVPGTMTTCNNIKLRDASIKLRIPIVGFYTQKGNTLENTQTEPDVRVENDKAELARGRDQQLETAVKELLETIKTHPKRSWPNSER